MICADSVLKTYTKALKRYDRDLFAGRTMDGMPCVFRKHKRYEVVCEWEGGKLLNLREDKQYVFAITDNWSMSGEPRDWGIDDVLGHLRMIDALANKRMFEEMDERNEQVDETNQRHLRTEMEGFWSHERRRFAKATDGILTHSLSKDEPRKRLKDRSIKNGNY
jgi:hypothetical protein